MLYALGVALLMAGCALMLLGRVRLASDLVISSRGARRAGAAFLAFFPVTIAVRFGLERIGWDTETVTLAVFWGVFGACLLAGLCLLAAGRENPERPPTPVPPDSSGSSPAEEKKPFDFS